MRFLDRISAAHGDVVRFHMPGQEVYLFSHPDAIEEVPTGRASRCDCSFR